MRLVRVIIRYHSQFVRKCLQILEIMKKVLRPDLVQQRTSQLRACNILAIP